MDLPAATTIPKLPNVDKTQCIGHGNGRIWRIPPGDERIKLLEILKYAWDEHRGNKIMNKRGNLIYPTFRNLTIHLTALLKNNFY